MALSSPRFPRMSWPLGAYFAAVAYFYWAGQPMVVPFHYPHLLSSEHLTERLAEALLYLHSQPPGLNLLLGLFLKLEQVTGIAPEESILAFHVLLGLLAVVGFVFLAHRFISLTWIRWFAIALFVLNPVFYMMIFLFFYTLHEMVLLLAMVMALRAWWLHGRPFAYVAVCAIAIALSNLHTLFHFVWAIAVTGAALWLKPAQANEAESRPGRIPLGCFALTVLLLLAWPAKNLAIFGHFTATSWQGFNLIQGTGINVLTLPEPSRSVPERFADVGVLSEFEKPGGRRNMNHYSVIEEYGRLQGMAIRAIVEEPSLIAAKIGHNYWSFTRPSARTPYSGNLNHAAPGVRPWLRLYEWVVLQDFRGSDFLWSTDNRIHTPEVIEGYEQKLRVSGFFLWFPIILIAAGLRIIRRRRVDPLGAHLAAYLLFCIVWVLASCLLIDGAEGHRLRFSTEPYLVLLACWALGPESGVRDSIQVSADSPASPSSEAPV